MPAFHFGRSENPYQAKTAELCKICNQFLYVSASQSLEWYD